MERRKLPEYVGQWARIRFPNADGLRTVTVSSGNEEIIVGTASEGIDSLCLENGAILLYAPEVSRKDIYLYLSDRTPYKTNPVSHISLQSAERSASLQIPCGVWPEMLIADRESGAALKSATVNEDALGALGLGRGDGAAAQHRLDAGHDLFGVEGLDHVDPRFYFSHLGEFQ